MKKVLNPQMILVAVGVLQPATPAEVTGFLNLMFSNAGVMPTGIEILEFLNQEVSMGRVLRIDGEPRVAGMYSLTLSGHRYLTRQQRKARDKFRFYLLRDAHRRRLIVPDSGATGLVGDAPTEDARVPIKGSVANKLGHCVPPGRAYWPRISRQFSKETGPSAFGSGNFPGWGSFTSQQQCERAIRCQEGSFQFDYEGLSACLGVSPAIISQIAHSPDRHYRTFPLSKPDGGVRMISAPRLFLKVIQWFLNDFVFSSLRVHDCVHSFCRGRSIVSNAQEHVGRAFVCNIDIRNFFGSIRKEDVEKFLTVSGFEYRESKVIAMLCCKEGCLPQGAPTSPLLSNAMLYDLDSRINDEASALGVTYTRYADDITFSGEKREYIVQMISRTKDILLVKYALSLNSSKTRIASSRSQQRVTGVVVNDKVMPPRQLRRKFRAMFHNAEKSGVVSDDERKRLVGCLAFLEMFPDFRASQASDRYRNQMNLVERGLSSGDKKRAMGGAK